MFLSISIISVERGSSLTEKGLGKLERSQFDRRREVGEEDGGRYG